MRAPTSSGVVGGGKLPTNQQHQLNPAVYHRIKSFYITCLICLLETNLSTQNLVDFWHHNGIVMDFKIDLDQTTLDVSTGYIKLIGLDNIIDIPVHNVIRVPVLTAFIWLEVHSLHNHKVVPVNLGICHYQCK